MTSQFLGAENLIVSEVHVHPCCELHPVIN